MTTQINQLTELTTTSDGDLLLIRESATGVDKKIQSQNLRAKATTKDDVGLGNVDNVSAADLRDRSTHTGTQTLSTISDAGTIASQDANSVNIDGGNIDGTPIGVSSASSGAFTTLTASGDVTIADKIVHAGDINTAIRFPSADTVTFETAGAEAMRIDSSGNVGIGASSPPTSLTVGNTASPVDSQVFRIYRGGGVNQYAEFDSKGGATNIRSQNGVGGGFQFIGDGNERMRIDSSGHAIIPAGVTLGTAAGVYNAANTLDDYEEGTWTPALTTSGTDFSSITYGSVNSGFYRKIGNVVYLTARIRVNSATIGSASGLLRLSGQPFSADLSVDNSRGTMAGGFSQGWAGTRIHGFYVSQASTMTGYRYVDGSNIAVVDYTALGTGVSEITISGFYFTA